MSHLSRRTIPARCLGLHLPALLLLAARNPSPPHTPAQQPWAPCIPLAEEDWWQRLGCLFLGSLFASCSGIAALPSFPACPAFTYLKTHLCAEKIPRNATCSSSACMPVNLCCVSSLSCWSFFAQLPLTLLFRFHFSSQPWQYKQGNSHLGDLIGIRAVTLSVFLNAPTHKSLGLW